MRVRLHSQVLVDMPVAGTAPGGHGPYPMQSFHSAVGSDFGASRGMKRRIALWLGFTVRVQDGTRKIQPSYPRQSFAFGTSVEKLKRSGRRFACSARPLQGFYGCAPRLGLSKALTCQATLGDGKQTREKLLVQLLKRVGTNSRTTVHFECNRHGSCMCSLLHDLR